MVNRHGDELRVNIAASSTRAVASAWRFQRKNTGITKQCRATVLMLRLK